MVSTHYDDEDDESTAGESAEPETLTVALPPRAELHIKFSSFFRLPRDEKNWLEREQPDVFRNGQFGVVFAGGVSGSEVKYPLEHVGTAVVLHLDEDGRVLSSEQVYP